MSYLCTVEVRETPSDDSQARLLWGDKPNGAKAHFFGEGVDVDSICTPHEEEGNEEAISYAAVVSCYFSVERCWVSRGDVVPLGDF